MTTGLESKYRQSSGETGILAACGKQGSISGCSGTKTYLCDRHTGSGSVDRHRSQKVGEVGNSSFLPPGTSTAPLQPLTLLQGSVAPE